MTDLIKGLNITLDKDYREDDVEAIIEAIKMIYGVASVRKSQQDSDDWMNRERIKNNVKTKLFKAVTDCFE